MNINGSIDCFGVAVNRIGEKIIDKKSAYIYTYIYHLWRCFGYGRKDVPEVWAANALE